jgi:hypothetical protein
MGRAAGGRELCSYVHYSQNAAPRQQVPRRAAIQVAGASGAPARETGIGLVLLGLWPRRPTYLGGMVGARGGGRVNPSEGIVGTMPGGRPTMFRSAITPTDRVAAVDLRPLHSLEQDAADIRELFVEP